MIAIGFCLLWQTAPLVNFAEGEFVTVPAFLLVNKIYIRRVDDGRTNKKGYYDDAGCGKRKV
jgi:branched-subunit amino acid ABC-type transport system permease component